MLGVSVSQFELSDSLNQVRHHQSSNTRKISPFPVWSGFSYGPQIRTVKVAAPQPVNCP